MTELKTTAARKAYMQKEIARALAQEKELWQKDREARATTADRERSQLQGELVMLHGYTMVLIGELASTAEWRSRVETLLARVTEL